jgi:hypothetical protein
MLASCINTNSNDPVKIWHRVTGWKCRCERCPTFQSYGKMHDAEILKRNRLASQAGCRAKNEGNLLDGYREEAQIYDSHGNPVSYIFLRAVGWNQTEANFVHAYGSAEIGNAECRADDTKSKTRPSGDDCNTLHNAKQPNVES